MLRVIRKLDYHPSLSARGLGGSRSYLIGLAVAHGLGLAVPEDLTVVGFDDVPLASQVWPALTTIRQPIPAMAAQAAELLLRQLRGEPYDRSGHVVESALMFRQSHGPSREREATRRLVRAAAAARIR